MSDLPASDRSIKRVALIAHKDFLALSPGQSCREALGELARAGHSHALVVAGDGTPAGLFGFAQGHQARDGSPVEAAMTPVVHMARADDAAMGLAQEMTESRQPVAAIVDAHGKVTAVVHLEDAQRHLIDELQDDADRFAGLTGEPVDDYFQHTIWSDFRRRIPWVLGLAVAGLAAGYVVHVYEHALDALVILALYMPMVADTGGNVGTQSSSLVTRAIAAGHISMRSAGSVLWREAGVSILVAAVLFAFAFLKVVLISNAADVPEGLTLDRIGLAIAIALSVQVITATLIGALLPLGAIAVKQDPAVVSGPALTTIVDLTGLLLYFTITTWLLGIPFVHD
jgi:magnesium transporter